MSQWRLEHHPMTAQIVPHIATVPRTPVDIAEACGHEVWRVLAHLGWMLRRGQVEIVGNSKTRFRATDRGLKAAQREASPYAEAAP